MKIDTKGEKIIVYINNDSLKSLNIKDTKNIEMYFKKIISILNNNYNIKLEGKYKVVMYTNNLYGIILEIKKEEDDNTWSTGIIDMKIVININSVILYEVNDYEYMNELDDEVEKYYYNNKYYCNLSKVDNNSFIRFLEYSKVLHGEEARGILIKALKIK